MKGRLRRLPRLLFPPLPLLLLLIPLAGGLLGYSFLRVNPEEPVSVAAYGLSAYTLTAVCCRVPALAGKVRQFRQKNRYVARYTSDVRLRMRISLSGTCLLNGAYAVFQLCLGIYHASVWFYAMAAYYLLLAGIRLMLAFHARNHGPGERPLLELKKYRLCGVCLLVLNLALSVILPYMVWQNRTFRHHEITTIAMAAYTFTALTLAIVNLIRYRRYKSPVYSAAKVISLCAAAVSMLTLETAMLTTFGQQNSPLFRQIMLSVSGGAVMLLILTMAIYMIVASTRQMKEIKHG